MIRTFAFAVKGISYGFRTQKNLRIQLAIFLVVLASAYALGFSMEEYMVLILCATLVFAVEMINTSIEVLVDLVSPEWNDKAGKVKDIAAGAVLIISIGVAVIGILLFARHF